MICMDVDAALSEVPVNVCPLTDDTDFKTLETSVAYNAAGMALYWHFVTTAGAYTATQVTPTSGGTYDWAHQAQGMYSIEIPASGGASINNDTEGFGWFTGFATGVLPWRGPTICFRDAALNNMLVDSAMNAHRGLAGTALPAAAADAAGGLPISDAGGLDLDAQVGTKINDVKAKTDNLPSDPADASVVAGLIAGVDAKVDTVDAVVDAILDDTGSSGVVVAASSKTGYRLSEAGVDDVLDEVVEGTWTLRKLLRGLVSALLAKVSGAETTEVTFRDIDDSKDRITATVDADGNRSAVTLDLD